MGENDDNNNNSSKMIKQILEQVQVQEEQINNIIECLMGS